MDKRERDEKAKQLIACELERMVGKNNCHCGIDFEAMAKYVFDYIYMTKEELANFEEFVEGWWGPAYD